ncbi:MAG: 30S ribosomal protein S16 [Thermomicrobiaceae bacterium]
MIKLRLRRMGAKKQPSYRIVAAESTKPRDGRFIEILGHYDPKTDPYTLRVDEERAKYWLDHGAQPTETVRSLLVKSGVLPGYQGPVATAEAKPAGKAAAAPSAEPAAEAEASQADDATGDEPAEETEN